MVTVSLRRPGHALGYSSAAWLAVKLFALALMLLDHFDWFLIGSALGLHSGVGRAVFPLFALVLARNLARVDPSHMLRSVAPRMAVVGAVAVVPYAYLAGWYPLNVMFTLAAAVAVHSLWHLGWRLSAVSLFVAAGAWVDYQWFGLACVLGAAIATRRGLSEYLQLAAMAVLLVPINGNLWALSALAFFAMCTCLDGPAPRYKWLFYAFYPLHLLALAAIAFHS